MPIIEGAPAELEGQGSYSFTFQSAASANRNGSVANTDGYNGAQMVEVNNAGTGGCTLSLEGSYDGSTWYAAGYQQVDNTAAPARSVTGITVAVSPFAHVYQVLDLYPKLRARISAAAAGLSLTVSLYAVGA